MGLADRIRGIFSRQGRTLDYSKPVAKPVRSPDWLWAQHPRFDYDLAAYAYRVWISTAIDRMAEICVSVPLEVRRKDTTEVVTDHPILELLGAYGRPNPVQDSLEFLEAHFQRMDVLGNDIWYWVSELGGAPTEVYQLDLQRVNIRSFEDRTVYEYRTGAQIEPLNPDQITHFRRPHILGSSPFWGASAIQKLREVVSQDAAMADWNAKFFKAGAHNGYLMVDPALVSDKQARELELEFLQDAEEGNRRLKVLRATPGAARWEPAGFNQRDVDFTRGVGITRQAAFDALGFHVGVVSESSTEAHARVAERFVRNSAHTRHMRSASRMNECLQFWPDWSMYQIRYSDVRVTDWEQERAKFQAVEPYMTINEVRARYLDLPPLDNGERLIKEEALDVAQIDD